jgi:hypothetical protein
MWINLSKLTVCFVVLIAIMTSVAMILSWTELPIYEVKFDCRQSEISPDYPIEVRERCKRIMKKYEKIN